MSTDNGIYVLKSKCNFKTFAGVRVRTPDYFVYRVAHVFAIDNFDDHVKNYPEELPEYLLRTWGNSPVFKEKDNAFSHAKTLLNQIGYAEYGISEIDWSSHFFPGDYLE